MDNVPNIMSVIVGTSIREKKRKIGKSKIFSLYEVHPGLTLTKNENFLKKFPNGPIRKVITLKVKFEDISKYFL